jgi:hypothetical protein
VPDNATFEKLSDEVQRNGVEGLMKVVKDKGLSAPRIPSRWFVEECIQDNDEKARAKAAREFGQIIINELEKLAQEQQTLPAGELLFKRTFMLCNAGDWCAETVGYGNIFLARRFLDLAAVGLARLTVATNYPLSNCEMLATRMTPPWLGMDYRLQLLNQEVGTNLFVNSKITNQELDWQWSVGWSMWTMKGKTDPGRWLEAPNPTFVNLEAFTNNLLFFTFTENPGSPVTLRRSWDCRQHRLIASGLALPSISKALSVLNFRSVVAGFPSKLVRSAEETKKRDAEIIEAAKWGIKITKAEDDPSYDPLDWAFRREWLKRPHRNVSEDNQYVIALQAYREVNGGVFYDLDTAEIVNINQQREMLKSRQKMESR